MRAVSARTSLTWMSAARTGAWRDNVRATLTAARTKLARRNWYEIDNQAGDVADIYLYDEIGMWGTPAGDFVRDLATITARRIVCHINSPGGEIFDGIAIYNSLKAHPAYVAIEVDSLAASIASVIAMAGDEITMMEGGQMMIHDGSGLCLGNAQDMRDMADLLDRQSDNIAGFYAARAGGTAKQWRDRMRAETWYTAAEAVAAGLADKVSSQAGPRSRTPAGENMDNHWDLGVFRYAGRDHAPAPDAAPAATDRAFPSTTPAEPTPEPQPEPAAELVDDLADALTWDDDLASVFTAAMRDEPDDDVVRVLREAGLKPAPAPEEPDVFIDPVEFYNAVREGTQ